MNALYAKMLDEIEAQKDREPGAVPAATPKVAAVDTPVTPAAAAAAPTPELGERALQELDALRGIVLGSQLGGLVDTIARVDAEVTAETRRVREAIADIDNRLTSRLDTLAVGGDRGRRQLAEELVHATQEIGDSLAKRNDEILATAETQFSDLRTRLLDSSDFNDLLKALLTKLG
jgi:hypothetical protein